MTHCKYHKGQKVGYGTKGGRCAVGDSDTYEITIFVVLCDFFLGELFAHFAVGCCQDGRLIADLDQVIAVDIGGDIGALIRYLQP